MWAVLRRAREETLYPWQVVDVRSALPQREEETIKEGKEEEREVEERENCTEEEAENNSEGELLESK